MVHLILFLIHWVDACSGPELQQGLQQQSTQVHCRGGNSLNIKGFFYNHMEIKCDYSDILHFGSDPSELEKPASFADTQAAKQSLSSRVMVSIYSAPYKGEAAQLWDANTRLRKTFWAGNHKNNTAADRWESFCISKFRTYPSLQINGEPIWHIDHLEALFNLFIKLHFPQVFTLASLEIKKKQVKRVFTQDLNWSD